MQGQVNDEFKVVPKKLLGKDLKDQVGKEISRVVLAITDAERRAKELESGVLALSKKAKHGELTSAIYVGGMYLKKLREKYNNL